MNIKRAWDPGRAKPDGIAFFTDSKNVAGWMSGTVAAAPGSVDIALLERTLGRMEALWRQGVLTLPAGTAWVQRERNRAPDRAVNYCLNMQSDAAWVNRHLRRYVSEPLAVCCDAGIRPDGSMGRAFLVFRICTGELIAAFASFISPVTPMAVADAARDPRAQSDPRHASRMINNLELQALCDAKGFLLAVKADAGAALANLPEERWMTRYRRAKLARLMKEDVWEPTDAEEP